MSIQMDQIANMPAFSPYYPIPPARYRKARFQFVYFRACTETVERVLPSCFEPSKDGFCVAIGLSVPWSANYGPFLESALTVKCSYQGQVGYFTVVAFLNSRSSIPAGREIYGTPKVFAELRVDMDERVMFTDTGLAGVSVMSIRSTMEQEAAAKDLPKLQPSWRLKVIPRADGKGAEVLQLIDCSQVTSNVTVHVCRAGQGVVQFHPSPIYDLSDFVPQKYSGTHYLEMDYTEGYGQIIHDFLAS